MSFVSQVQKYDPAEAEAEIADFQAELDDEIVIRGLLDATTADKLAAAKAFLADSAEKVSDQLARIQDLDSKIREAVSINETIQQNDAEYNALITSDQYVSLASQISQFNALVISLGDFLVKKGRRGRPQN